MNNVPLQYRLSTTIRGRLMSYFCILYRVVCNVSNKTFIVANIVVCCWIVQGRPRDNYSMWRGKHSGCACVLSFTRWRDIALCKSSQGSLTQQIYSEISLCRKYRFKKNHTNYYKCKTLWVCFFSTYLRNGCTVLNKTRNIHRSHRTLFRYSWNTYITFIGYFLSGWYHASGDSDWCYLKLVIK